MERSDWTPAVLITATISLVTAGLVFLVAPWGPRGPGDGSDTIPRHRPRPQVVVWTGDLSPGLKGVLAPVWGDEKPDRDHDALLNRDLGLEGPRALAYFRLLVFNTSAETQSLDLDDGQILMKGSEGAVALRSLAAMAERGDVALEGSLEFSLRSLGALTRTLELPPGRFAQLVVPFEAPARIDTAEAVVTRNGTALRRRQIAQAAYRRLLEDPDELQVKDL